MPRPLRQPTDTERAEFDIITDITRTILTNIERNKNLSTDRRERVQSLIDRGWSMYGVAVETGMSPNTVKRIIDGKKS